MDKVQLKEAILACEDTMDKVNSAISELRSARNWGIMDIIGGGFFSSLIKRNKINNASYMTRELNNSIIVLRRELEDININMVDFVETSELNKFFDVWFDNIFSDLSVQSEINSNLAKLEDFKDKLDRLYNLLNSKLKEIE